MMRTRVCAPQALFIMGALMACAGSGTRDPRPSDARGDAAMAAPDTAPPAEALGRARTAANALGRELQAALLAALDSGGPARAVAYCADSAQVLTARHAREGVYLRRVSLRVRNPANRPDAVEERMLRRFDSLRAAGSLPSEVARSARSPSGERVVEYARPILVQPACLACHGDRERLAPGVREILRTRYPSDQAVGYRVGDLRGLISVRVPLRPAR